MAKKAFARPYSRDNTERDNTERFPQQDGMAIELHNNITLITTWRFFYADKMMEARGKNE